MMTLALLGPLQPCWVFWGIWAGGGSFPTHSSFPAQGRHAAVASRKEKEMLQKKKVILMNIALHFRLLK